MNMEELMRSIHALKDELREIEMELSVEQVGMTAAVSKWRAQQYREQLLRARAKGAHEDEIRDIETELVMEYATMRAAAAEWRCKKCTQQILKAQKEESEKKSSFHAPASFSRVSSLATPSAALMSVSSDLTLHHPDFEKLVDELSSRVGGCDEEQDASPSALVVHGQVGYVYAAWNPLFPDLIKIGATMRAFPYLRVQELSSCAGVPEPFQLVASIPTPDPFALERAIHAFYASVRKYGRKKEFFLLSREEAVYHFHVRSLEAMGSGVSSSVEKVKKRKASEAGRQERKHAKHFDTQEAEQAFKDNLMSFLKTRVRVSDKAFLSTKDIEKSFAECASRMPSNQLFSKTLRGQIRTLFPAAVTGLWKESRGYYGITFE